MDIAYCPYCGVKITIRGQTICSNCSENIIDIWKLLDSGFPIQSPRPTPTAPRPPARIGPLVLMILALLLMLVVGYFFFSQLLGSGQTDPREGLVLPPVAGVLGYPVNPPAAHATMVSLGLFAGFLAPTRSARQEPRQELHGPEQSLASSQTGWTAEMKAAVNDLRHFQRSKVGS